MRFYERMEVRDVLAYCKVVANPDDSTNLKRIINIPRRGIGKASVDLLEAKSAETGRSMMDLLRSGAQSAHGLPAAAAKRCQAFLELFASLESVAEHEPAPRVVEAIVEKTGYMKYLKDDFPDSEARIENVEELVNAAHLFAESSEDKSLRAFLEEVALVADVDALDPEKGALTLMTLHNAKGLEFDCVVITGLEEGLFPHYNSIDSDREVEEERRLFYVGMTRARKHLYLSCASVRRRMGHIEGSVPSRFLLEVPEQCLEHAVAGASAGRASAGAEGATDGADGWESRTRDDVAAAAPPAGL